MFEAYFPILVFFVLALVTVGSIPILSALFGRRHKSENKDAPYECGITDVKAEPRRISIRFYILAMLFIVFDLEVAFLYPWATVMRKLGLFALVEMILFIVVLFAGLVYAWRIGALDWE
ncbi:NADH-quinone oxidoreductase subunit A [Acidobacteriota bacterium]